MIVVDSSVWIGLFAGVNTPQVERLLAVEDRTQILVGDIVMLEVLRGARSDSAARRIEHGLRQFDLARMLDPDIAVSAAGNYRRLRALGVTIRSTVDVIIATYCITYGHHLLHRDRDYDHIARHLALALY